MNPIPNSAAPYKDPNGIRAVVVESLEPATIAVMTSGAPTAKATKLIPASASEILHFSMNCSMQGVR